MKPHPRIRKTIKWGGAVVTVLLVVAWITSGWWLATYSASNGYVGSMSAGCLWLAKFSPPPIGANGLEWSPVANTPHYSWGFSHDRGPGRWAYLVPLWPAVFFVAGITALAWCFDRKACRTATAHSCPKCNYNRAGIAGDAKCPECGAPAPAHPSSPPSSV